MAFAATHGDEPPDLDELLASYRSGAGPAAPAGRPAPGYGNLLRAASQQASLTAASLAADPPPHLHQSSPPPQYSQASVPAHPSQYQSSPSSFSQQPSSQNPATLDRTTSLLNLLRQGQAAEASHSTASPPGAASASPAPPFATAIQNVHGRGVSASDLVASFMGKPAAQSSPRDEVPSPSATTATRLPAANPQDFLLSLLNRSQSANTPSSNQEPAGAPGFQKPPASPQPSGLENLNLAAQPPQHNEMSPSQSPSKTGAALRVFGTQASREPTPFDPQDLPSAGQNKSSLFDHVNPFDQLAASSPRNLQARSGNATPAKPSKNSTSSPKPDAPVRSTTQKKPQMARKAREPGPSKSSTKEAGNDDQHNDGRSIVEAMLGIGDALENPGQLAQALHDADSQTGSGLEAVLVEAASGSQDIVQSIEKEIPGGLQALAQDAQHDLTESGGQDALEMVLPPDAAHTAQKVLDEAANGNIDGAQASADDEQSSDRADDEVVVPVYTFPMKPFVSIDLTYEQAPTLSFRPSTITDIARFKKDFDQIDRTLATASNDFIVYAIPKPGGFRVIRQEDGRDQQAFKERKDPIFTVALSSSRRTPDSIDMETCIGTGLSGTVYWSVLRDGAEDAIETGTMEKHGLIFPPVPSSDEHTSAGQLKTRAKQSNRHPELFAIGRGKTIHIVNALRARTSGRVKKQVVDTSRYLQDNNLRISTGKAGKDFTFSDDDTVIATLDKAGRLKLWDARELTAAATLEADAASRSSIEVREPLVAFSTVSASEKSWPTSVLFVDKARAYQKRSALRYVIVGMKQNHTLQLWDLALGKPVQEINFPHQQETDAICSVAYHPSSGIVVVGHPTRNSIYFIHLSAPKYQQLHHFSQAEYLQKIVNHDPTIPRPESTAIMSGVREYSFASKGQLRSLDLVSPDAPTDRANPGLFELYVMHSKGVTCIDVHKADLGWGHDNKTIKSCNAEEAGWATIRDLRKIISTHVSEHSSLNGDTLSSAPARSTLKTADRKGATLTNAATENVSKSRGEEPESGAPNSNAASERSDKRRKKRNNATDDSAQPNTLPAPSLSERESKTLRANSAMEPDGQEPQLATKKQSSKAVDGGRSGAAAAHPLSDGDTISLGISPEFVEQELRKFGDVVSTEFTSALRKGLDTLYRRIDDDKRALDAAGAAKHDAVLRLVSSTLSENVEKTLSRIVLNSISQHVAPVLHNVTANTLRNEIMEWLDKNFLPTLAPQLRSAIPAAVSDALQTPAIVKQLADGIGSKIVTPIEKQVATQLQKGVPPSSHGQAGGDLAQRKMAEMEQRFTEQLQRLSQSRSEDAAKINDLTQMVKSLTETVNGMAASQAQLHQAIARRSSHASRVRESSNGSNAVASEVQGPIARPKSPLSLDLEHVQELVSMGRNGEASVAWIKSSFQAKLFDRFFVQIDPVSHLRGSEGLIKLSVAAAVTVSLQQNLSQRLDWLSAALSTLDPRESDIPKIIERIAGVICSRLESTFMQISEVQPSNPILRRIPPLTRRIRDLVSYSASV